MPSCLGNLIFIKKSGLEGIRVPVVKNKVSIGSSYSCDIRLITPGIENVHCTLFVHLNSTALLQNHSTKNPVQVNLQPVKKNALLKENDVITILDKKLIWKSNNERSNKLPRKSMSALLNLDGKSKNIPRRQSEPSQKLIAVVSPRRRSEGETLNDEVVSPAELLQKEVSALNLNLSKQTPAKSTPHKSNARTPLSASKGLNSIRLSSVSSSKGRKVSTPRTGSTSAKKSILNKTPNTLRSSQSSSQLNFEAINTPSSGLRQYSLTPFPPKKQVSASNEKSSARKIANLKSPAVLPKVPKIKITEPTPSKSCQESKTLSPRNSVKKNNSKPKIDMMKRKSYSYSTPKKATPARMSFSTSKLLQDISNSNSSSSKFITALSKNVTVRRKAFCPEKKAPIVISTPVSNRKSILKSVNTSGKKLSVTFAESVSYQKIFSARLSKPRKFSLRKISENSNKSLNPSSDLSSVSLLEGEHFSSSGVDLSTELINIDDSFNGSNNKSSFNQTPLSSSSHVSSKNVSQNSISEYSPSENLIGSCDFSIKSGKSIDETTFSGSPDSVVCLTSTPQSSPIKFPSLENIEHDLAGSASKSGIEMSQIKTPDRSASRVLTSTPHYLSHDQKSSGKGSAVRLAQSCSQFRKVPSKSANLCVQNNSSHFESDNLFGGSPKLRASARLTSSFFNAENSASVIQEHDIEDCYEVKIIPKTKTPRYFKSTLSNPKVSTSPELEVSDIYNESHVKIIPKTKTPCKSNDISTTFCDLVSLSSSSEEEYIISPSNETNFISSKAAESSQYSEAHTLIESEFSEIQEKENTDDILSSASSIKNNANSTLRSTLRTPLCLSNKSQTPVRGVRSSSRKNNAAISTPVFPGLKLHDTSETPAEGTPISVKTPARSTRKAISGAKVPQTPDLGLESLFKTPAKAIRSSKKNASEISAPVSPDLKLCLSETHVKTPSKLTQKAVSEENISKTPNLNLGSLFKTPARVTRSSCKNIASEIRTPVTPNMDLHDAFKTPAKETLVVSARTPGRSTRKAVSEATNLNLDASPKSPANATQSSPESIVLEFCSPTSPVLELCDMFKTPAEETRVLDKTPVKSTRKAASEEDVSKTPNMESGSLLETPARTTKSSHKNIASEIKSPVTSPLSLQDMFKTPVKETFVVPDRTLVKSSQKAISEENTSETLNLELENISKTPARATRSSCKNTKQEITMPNTPVLDLRDMFKTPAKETSAGPSKTPVRSTRKAVSEKNISETSNFDSSCENTKQEITVPNTPVLDLQNVFKTPAKETKASPNKTPARSTRKAVPEKNISETPDFDSSCKNTKQEITMPNTPVLNLRDVFKTPEKETKASPHKTPARSTRKAVPKMNISETSNFELDGMSQTRATLSPRKNSPEVGMSVPDKTPRSIQKAISDESNSKTPNLNLETLFKTPGKAAQSSHENIASEFSSPESLVLEHHDVFKTPMKETCTSVQSPARTTRKAALQTSFSKSPDLELGSMFKTPAKLSVPCISITSEIDVHSPDYELLDLFKTPKKSTTVQTKMPTRSVHSERSVVSKSATLNLNSKLKTPVKTDATDVKTPVLASSKTQVTKIASPASPDLNLHDLYKTPVKETLDVLVKTPARSTRSTTALEKTVSSTPDLGLSDMFKTPAHGNVTAPIRTPAHSFSEIQVNGIKMQASPDPKLNEIFQTPANKSVVTSAKTPADVACDKVVLSNISKTPDLELNIVFKTPIKNNISVKPPVYMSCETQVSENIGPASPDLELNSIFKTPGKDNFVSTVRTPLKKSPNGSVSLSAELKGRVHSSEKAALLHASLKSPSKEVVSESRKSSLRSPSKSCIERTTIPSSLELGINTPAISPKDSSSGAKEVPSEIINETCSAYRTLSSPEYDLTSTFKTPSKSPMKSTRKMSGKENDVPTQEFSTSSLFQSPKKLSNCVIKLQAIESCDSPSPKKGVESVSTVRAETPPKTKIPGSSHNCTAHQSMESIASEKSINNDRSIAAEISCALNVANNVSFTSDLSSLPQSSVPFPKSTTPSLNSSCRENSISGSSKSAKSFTLLTSQSRKIAPSSEIKSRSNIHSPKEEPAKEISSQQTGNTSSSESAKLVGAANSPTRGVSRAPFRSISGKLPLSESDENIKALSIKSTPSPTLQSQAFSFLSRSSRSNPKLLTPIATISSSKKLSPKPSPLSPLLLDMLFDKSRSSRKSTSSMDETSNGNLSLFLKSVEQWNGNKTSESLTLTPDATTFDFNAAKTPCVPKDMFVSPLSESLSSAKTRRKLKSSSKRTRESSLLSAQKLAVSSSSKSSDLSASENSATRVPFVRKSNENSSVTKKYPEASASSVSIISTSKRSRKTVASSSISGKTSNTEFPSSEVAYLTQIFDTKRSLNFSPSNSEATADSPDESSAEQCVKKCNNQSTKRKSIFKNTQTSRKKSCVELNDAIENPVAENRVQNSNGVIENKQNHRSTKVMENKTSTSTTARRTRSTRNEMSPKNKSVSFFENVGDKAPSQTRKQKARNFSKENLVTISEEIDAPKTKRGRLHNQDESQTVERAVRTPAAPVEVDNSTVVSGRVLRRRTVAPEPETNATIDTNIRVEKPSRGRPKRSVVNQTPKTDIPLDLENNSQKPLRNKQKQKSKDSLFTNEVISKTESPKQVTTRNRRKPPVEKAVPKSEPVNSKSTGKKSSKKQVTPVKNLTSGNSEMGVENTSEKSLRNRRKPQLENPSQKVTSATKTRKTKMAERVDDHESPVSPKKLRKGPITNPTSTSTQTSTKRTAKKSITSNITPALNKIKTLAGTSSELQSSSNTKPSRRKVPAESKELPQEIGPRRTRGKASIVEVKTSKRGKKINANDESLSNSKDAPKKKPRSAASNKKSVTEPDLNLQSKTTKATSGNTKKKSPKESPTVVKRSTRTSKVIGLRKSLKKSLSPRKLRSQKH